MSWNDDLDDPWADSSFDEDEGGRDDQEETFGAQHVLVLIDSRPPMFVKSIPVEGSDLLISPMQASLNVCEYLLRSKVKHVAVHKTGKRDGVGVMLYGVPSPQHPTHSLVDLEQPGIAQILKIQAYVNDETSVLEGCEKDKTEKVGWTLRRALQAADGAINKAKCVHQRKASDKALPDGKSLWIFTTDDDPLADEEESSEKVEKAASDLLENGVDVHLMPLKTPFNSEFYDSILSSPVETQEDMFDMDDLMDRIKRDFRKHRIALRLPMLLPNWRQKPDDPGIMIDFYRPMQIQKKPQPRTIHQETKRETQKYTSTLDESTGQILHTTRKNTEAPSEKKLSILRTITQFGGRTIPISKEEVAEMKKQSNADQDKASLILLGFKPKDSVPLHYNVEQAFYLYPNEDKVKGSTAAFANLHASMRRKGMVAIGELLTRVTATSRLVAIFPQEEKYLPEEAGGDLEVPQCMVAYSLPFEDDVRELEPDSGTTTEDMFQAASNLIAAMKFGDDFALDYFKNDSLAHFYTYLESVALETTLPEPEQTLNQISDDEVRANAGEQIDAFVASLPEDIVMKKAPKKRKREPDESGCDWISLHKQNELDDCTMPMLKSYLKSVGEKLSGNKGALVERVSLSITARLASGELQDV